MNLERLYPALTAALLAAVMLSASCSRTSVSANAPGASTGPVEVRAVEAKSSDVPLDVSAIGNVEAISTVDVKARITAPVLRVSFTDGQDVRQGQLLFELDPETYNRQIAELEANIAKDVANEQQAKANILKDQSTLKNANSIAGRAAKLQKDGIFSREQTEQLAANAESAQASIEADQAALESDKASEKADGAKLAETKLQLGYTKVYAPISGRAGAILVKPGNLASENSTTLVTILQVSPIYVTFSVPEDVLQQVRGYNSSRPLEVSAIAADHSITAGKLVFIDNAVDATTGTIKLKAAFDNPRRVLWPGQFVTVNARLDLEHDRILVPLRTVESGPDGKYVWVVGTDGTASMRPVKVLRDYTPAGQSELAVIGSGLRQGEKVVSEGQLRLAPGAHVRLLQSNTSSAS